MIAQLDNPVWLALTSGNKALSAGNDKARHFLIGISPFVAVAKHDAQHFLALSKLMQPTTTAAIFTVEKHFDASPLKIVNRIEGYQIMVQTRFHETKLASGSLTNVMYTLCWS
jgi:hypothetical protein